MGLVNPAYLVQSGNTLVDLRDRTAQVRVTSTIVPNALASSGGTATAGANGKLPFSQFLTSTVLNNVASGTGSGLGQTYGIPYRLTTFQIHLGQTTNCRVFFGIGSATGSNWTSDTPSNDAYGFRFSTNVPDTNWQCVNNGGGSNTVTDSGVAATTNQLIFAVEAIGSTKINFYINRVLVKTNSNNLPRTSVTNYSPVFGIANLLGGATRFLDYAIIGDRMHSI